VVVGSAPVVGGSVVVVGTSVVVGAAVVVGTVVVVASVVVVEMDVVVGAVTKGGLVPLTVEPPAVIEVASTLACAWAMTDGEIAVGVLGSGDRVSAAGVTRVAVVVGSRAPVVGVEADLDAG
jgi:hypothetical protein